MITLAELNLVKFTGKGDKISLRWNPSRGVGKHGIGGYRHGCRCAVCRNAKSENKKKYG